MKTRCSNPKQKLWHCYGGRGVRVCKRWARFENFLADMGPRPDGTTLGRVLDMGNYTVGNTFWMTREEQLLAARNKRALMRWSEA
jgi:hypothetical protein